MKRYEAYKDSGIEWLGEIPEHWEVCRTKDIVSLINDKATDTSLKKVALENIESKTGKYIDTDSEYESEGTLFQKDDILFGKLRPYLAKVYRAEFKGQSVGDIYVFRRKNDNNPDFLKYVFISDMFISVVDGSTYGAKMPRANWDFISNLRLAIPSIDEQRKISAYLDFKVSHIDSLISEKQKQIEDLQKYRASLISETVTRGLHPDVEMKDSGVEWLGKIPEHWEIYRTKNIVNLINERTTDTSLKKVALENIESGTGKYIETNSEYEGDGVLFQNDDILFGKLRPYLAKVYKAEFKGQSIGDIYVFRGKEYNNANFLKYLFVSDLFISIVDGSTYGTKMPRANWDFISNIKLAMPSFEEQQEIADYLDEKTAKIETTINELKTQIENLRQYKTSVISEAVTGKVDLRDWKPK